MPFFHQNPKRFKLSELFKRGERTAARKRDDAHKKGRTPTRARRDASRSSSSIRRGLFLTDDDVVVYEVVAREDEEEEEEEEEDKKEGVLR